VPPRSSTFAPFAFSVGAVEMSKLYAIVATTKGGKKKNENVMKTAGRLRPTVPTRPIGKLNGLKNRRCTVGPQVKWENIAQIEVLCFSKHLKTCIYCSIIDHKIQALAW